MDDRITTGGDNECTSYPWWAIVDPRPAIAPRHALVGRFASAITGPFFSRASAEEVLRSRRYRFGKHAAVYCFSGHMSPDYMERINAGRAAAAAAVAPEKAPEIACTRCGHGRGVLGQQCPVIRNAGEDYEHRCEGVMVRAEDPNG